MSDARQDVLIIEGMFCAACAASVEATLAKQPGIERASVNFSADAAVIQWVHGTQSRAEAIEAVSRLGYSARFAGDERGTQAGATPARALAMRLVIAVFFGMWTMLPSVALYFGGAGEERTDFLLALAAGALSVPVVAYCGVPFYRMGLATLRAGVAGVDTLITFGVAGSVALSAVSLSRGGADVYFEVAVALITLQLAARLIESRTRRRARDAVLGLLELAPATVRLVTGDGEEEVVPLRAARSGAVARLRPGDRIAIDGRVTDGRAHVDRSLLSGQSDPVLIAPGGAVYAGERVLDGSLTVEVCAGAGARRIDQLARQVRQMLAAKPHWQRIAERIARHFLWLSALAALIGAALVLASGGPAHEAAVRALAVFVIACPCALSLAAPIVGMSAAAAAARRGIVLRDLNAVTSGASPDIAFLDKTGTLTVGRPRVIAVDPAPGESRASVLALAATAERDAEHPVANAIVKAAKRSAPAAMHHPRGTLVVSPGRGVEWSDGSTRIAVARTSALVDAGVAVPALPPTAATRVGVARDGRFVGSISLADTPRPGAAAAIDALRARGIEPVILSGDDAGPVSAVAEALGVTAHAALSPEDKVAHIESRRRSGATVAFCGDGLNDGPALAAADLGVAVGGATDVAAAAAAVSFVEADITTLPDLFDLTRRAGVLIRQNLALAIGYNAVAVPAAVLGWVHPAVAAIAMALSSLSVSVNATRFGRRAGGQAVGGADGPTPCPAASPAGRARNPAAGGAPPRPAARCPHRG